MKIVYRVFVIDELGMIKFKHDFSSTEEAYRFVHSHNVNNNLNDHAEDPIAVKVD